jgi:hypothetical protein
MMINVKNEETNRTKYVPIGLIVAFILMLEVYMQFPQTLTVKSLDSYSINGGETNVH